MPPESEYSLQDLSDLAGVTPRTIRYYIAQGLLPSPGKAGPGATYADGHLNRLRLIKRLQREHLPLAEIRTRLAALDDGAVAALVEVPASEPPADSAIDYIRAVLGGDSSPDGMLWDRAPDMTSRRSPIGPPASPPPSTNAVDLRAPAYRLAEPSPAHAEPPTPTPTPAPDRSQWDRILLAPDVELHVRRPLGRRAHKRVERLIQIARELLEEDQP
jgi:DNA-binding transcriptional MerR regulator